MNLKEDLRNLDWHYAALPEAVKAQGVGGFAPGPPSDGDYLATKLWDRFLPRWRKPIPPASEGIFAADLKIWFQPPMILRSR
jgi:hypothetical protein